MCLLVIYQVSAGRAGGGTVAEGFMLVMGVVRGCINGDGLEEVVVVSVGRGGMECYFKVGEA